MLEFRGWDGYKMRDMLSINFNAINEVDYDEYSCDDSAYFEPTLMQYTGLKDKNGKKIFEGDIVKSQDDGGDYATYKDVLQVVELDTGSFYPVSERYSGDFEVIGNIYENKELLNVNG